MLLLFFFFNDTATTEIYTLSLHDALPISRVVAAQSGRGRGRQSTGRSAPGPPDREGRPPEQACCHEYPIELRCAYALLIALPERHLYGYFSSSMLSLQETDMIEITT